MYDLSEEAHTRNQEVEARALKEGGGQSGLCETVSETHKKMRRRKEGESRGRKEEGRKEGGREEGLKVCLK